MGEHRRVIGRLPGRAAIEKLVPACRSEPVEPRSTGAPAAAAAPAEHPVDEALPDEIAEGTEQAFGLLLPRRMAVKARFSDAVVAAGKLPAEAVSNYVRERVDATHIDTGPAKTVFTDAKIRAARDRVVRVEVVVLGAQTQLIVRDETRPPAKPGLSEEERWRELGLKPDGTPLDPKHLE